MSNKSLSVEIHKSPIHYLRMYCISQWFPIRQQNYGFAYPNCQSGLSPLHSLSDQPCRAVLILPTTNMLIGSISYILKNRKYLTWSLSAAVESSGKVAGIGFSIEFTWHVARPLIWILSIMCWSYGGQSVFLTTMNFFLLSLFLFCSVVQWYNFNWYWARALIHKYEQTSGCVRPQFRVLWFSSLSKCSLFNNEEISVTSGPLLKFTVIWIIKKKQFQTRTWRYLCIQCIGRIQSIFSSLTSTTH